MRLGNRTWPAGLKTDLRSINCGFREHPLASLKRLYHVRAVSASRREQLSVTNTGIGIPSNKQAKIFNSFEQTKGCTTREYGATGLGSAVSTQLVHMMGGSIWVESNVGARQNFSVHRSSRSTGRTDKYFDLFRTTHLVLMEPETPYLANGPALNVSRAWVHKGLQFESVTVTPHPYVRKIYHGRRGEEISFSLFIMVWTYSGLISSCHRGYPPLST